MHARTRILHGFNAVCVVIRIISIFLGSHSQENPIKKPKENVEPHLKKSWLSFRSNTFRTARNSLRKASLAAAAVETAIHAVSLSRATVKKPARSRSASFHALLHNANAPMLKLIIDHHWSPKNVFCWQGEGAPRTHKKVANLNNQKVAQL